MPRSLPPATLRIDAVPSRTIHATHETRATRDSRTVAECEARIAENKLATHNAEHTANVRDCEHCENERASKHDFAATRERARNAAKDATPRTGDTPSRISSKVRTTRNVVSPVIAGDTTRNAPSRKSRVRQRYAEDYVTRAVSDTVVTNEHDATVSRVIRNTSPLHIKEGGVTDVQATLFVLSFYRHLLGCRTNTNRKV
jgi:hypothetical protein